MILIIQNYCPIADDYVSDILIARYSGDRVVNEYGSYLLDVCKTTDMRIMNERVGNDKYKRRFTYVNNGSSVIQICLMQT